MSLSDISESLTTETNSWTQYPITLTHKQIKGLLKSLHQSVYFDSGSDSDRGKFDILSGEPLAVSRINKNNLKKNKKQNHRPLPFFERERLDIPLHYRNLPFICGTIGFCSYEFGAHKIIDAPKILESSSLPSAFFAHYTWSYVYNRETKQGYITFSPACTVTTRQKVLTLINDQTVAQKQTLTSTPWKKTISFDHYSKKIADTLNYIKQGDCYQINLAQQFECTSNEDSLDLYFNLRQNLNTPYSVFFSFSEGQNILCFSPEQFMGINNKTITTSPIKGTTESTAVDEIDAINALNLQQSHKNQAENVMIVDLMRNDLSKVCQLNSVKVNKLFHLNTFKNVHHLISEIEGTLKPGISEFEAFMACFPGGSITGAPKKRAMEIINELELTGRDAYCGSVFYWNDDGQFDSNILIRTIVHSDQKLFCWGGGGIVSDSTAEEEYDESLFKVSNLTGITC